MLSEKKKHWQLPKLICKSAQYTKQSKARIPKTAKNPNPNPNPNPTWVGSFWLFRYIYIYIYIYKLWYQIIIKGWYAIKSNNLT